MPKNNRKQDILMFAIKFQEKNICFLEFYYFAGILLECWYFAGFSACCFAGAAVTAHQLKWNPWI